MSSPDPLSVVRSPRFRVLAGGFPIESAIEAHIFSTNTYSADRFSVSFRCSFGTESGLADYIALSTASILEIRVSLDPAHGYQFVISGRADTLTWDYTSRRLHLEGRDRSGALQDTPANEAFINQTSSEIAILLALRHGLVPAVFPTTTQVGRYFLGNASQVVYNQFNRISTEWDLLVYLARCEGFDVFVREDALYFQPSAAVVVPAVSLHVQDLIHAQFRRRLRLAGDLLVTVRSWSAKKSAAVTQTAVSRPSGVLGRTVGPNTSQRFSLVHPNLSDAEAAGLAVRRVGELSRHGQSLELSMPGELALAPRSRFTLNGTGSVFDQMYEIDTIERILSSTSGFTERITAHSVADRQVELIEEVISLDGAFS